MVLILFRWEVPPLPLANPNDRRLSDAELLETELRFHDPENIAGLSPAVPDPAAHPTIIGYYDERPPGGRKANPDAPMIRCCHCGLRRHWQGYVVRDDREELYIIGAQQCGREHYGGRFEAVESAFRQERERKKALSRWRHMVKLLPDLTDEAATILRSSGLSAIEMKRDEIRRASPQGFDRLVRYAGSGEQMVEVREERNHAAEAEREQRFQRAMAGFLARPPEERRRLRDEGLKPELDNTPIIDRLSEPLGPLMGGGFLTAAGDVRAAALALRDTLKAAETLEAEGTDVAWLADLSRILSEMTDRPKRLRDAMIEASFSAVFFEADNLDRLKRWSASHARFAFFHENGALVVEDSSRGRTVIQPLRDIDLPMTRLIDRMNYYTSEFLPMIADAA